MNTIETITVIGLGRIGLPTAVALASSGFTVTGCDRDKKRRETIRNGEAPFQEPGLDSLISSCLSSGGFEVTDKPAPADATIICIGTTNEDGVFDASEVLDLVDSTDPETLVIIESTLPPGTCGRRRDRRLAYCPERVAPGQIFRTMYDLPRLVSAFDEDDREIATQIYYQAGFKRLEHVAPEEAEVIKLAENAFRDANIAFANQLAMTCYELDVDVRRVIEVANTHPNVGIHDPGIGVGGACLAPASRALAEPNDFFDAVRGINDAQIDRVAFYLTEIDRVSVWGVGYKRDSDDRRYSPADALIENLQEDNHVTVWDPVIGLGSLEAAVKDTAAIIVGCGHTVFGELDPADVATMTDARLVIDFTGTLDPDQWRSAGFSCIWR